jgi:hypothetical protein
MLSCLETRWLKGPKWLPAPTIVVASKTFCGNCDGMCFFPRKEVFVDGRYYDARNGLLMISEVAHAGTLAHEYRHHWQWFAGYRKYDGASFECPVGGDYATYRAAIVRYFAKSRYEWDALLYEIVKAPENNPAHNWMDWIQCQNQTGKKNAAK